MFLGSDKFYFQKTQWEIIENVSDLLKVLMSRISNKLYNMPPIQSAKFGGTARLDGVNHSLNPI